MLKSFYNNTSATILITLAILVGGLVKFFDLPIALYPDSTQPVLYVGMGVKNYTPQDFRNKFGKDIERKFFALEGVKEVTGSYEFNQARWQVTFDWSHPQKKAKSDVDSALKSYNFPEEWGTPWTYYDTSGNASVWATLYSEKYSSDELFHLLQDSLQSEINRLGYLDGFVSRPFDEQIKIVMKEDRLLELEVFPDDIYKALQKKIEDGYLGNLRYKKGESYHVVLQKKDLSIDDLKQTIILERQGHSIRLQDLAEVFLESKAPDWLVRTQGVRALLVGGQISPEGNIAKISEEFLKAVRTSAQLIDPDIHVDVLLDPSEFINEAIKNVIEAILIGVLVATIIIFLFLGSLSSTFIVALTMPLSLIGGFIFMSLMGIEVNLISLGAMSLAVGMVVDGAVVIVENISRHFEMQTITSRKMKLDVICAAVKEVANAVIASQLTTKIVFLPLIFTAPLSRALLGDLAKVIICVLLLSLFVTIFMIPSFAMLQKDFKSRKGRLHSFHFVFKSFVESLEKFYLSILRIIFSNRLVRNSLIVFTCLFSLAMFFVLKNYVRREIMTIPTTDKIWVNMDFLDGKTSMDDTEKKVEPIEQEITRVFGPKIKYFFTQINRNSSQILINLKDKKDFKEMMKALENKFQNSSKVQASIFPWTPSSIRLPETPLFSVHISGADSDVKREMMIQLKEIGKSYESVGEISLQPSVEKEFKLDVKVNEEELNLLKQGGYAITEDDISSFVSNFLSSRKIKNIYVQKNDWPVELGFKEDLIESPEDIQNLLLRKDDIFFPLRALVKTELNSAWGSEYGVNGHEDFRVKAYVKQSESDSLKKVRAEVLEEIKKNPHIDMKYLRFDDPDKETNENIYSLISALCLSLILIWIMITLQFGSFLDTLVIMIAVPLGFMGVGLSLFIFQSTLCVNSMLGFILLSGTAVNNSILFVDFFNLIRGRHQTLPLIEQILETARLRLRPILITTATTILGMIPIAFGLGSGGEVLQPLGIAVSGGLWVSTVFTLLLVPVALFIIHREKKIEHT